MTQFGRQLGIGPTDNTSDQRTPRKPLRLIPSVARESFVPVVPARYVTRTHEWDMTRIAPRAHRQQEGPVSIGVRRGRHLGPTRRESCDDGPTRFGSTRQGVVGILLQDHSVADQWPHREIRHSKARQEQDHKDGCN